MEAAHVKMAEVALADQVAEVPAGELQLEVMELPIPEVAEEAVALALLLDIMVEMVEVE